MAALVRKGSDRPTESARAAFGPRARALLGPLDQEARAASARWRSAPYYGLGKAALVQTKNRRAAATGVLRVKLT
jgi:hypothetical protein